ncbi:MAG: tellurite resistance/C4-dicarboxylate transporter family protein [Pseudomonadota bacterium]|jgi:tellurite resistance protein TehA-like permease|uniref:tellurite resistance/C4-dicarboxylate transporter family protein n=1 Tax=Thermomonas sp. TaxID=1971895 RepID=UPI001AC45B08|nr:tellurite resistance/C4-dicarboxylate transporter family protein [Xanthomonadales bacterium]MBN8794304.1 tellurite resistance/C4-dicarboxylate transporter family protein [Stenotrophomonas nitritireducens]
MPALLQRVRASTENLSPGYFSMVMATGILSLAAHMLHVPVLPIVLLALNWCLFVVIGALALAHLYWHPRRVLDDLFSHLNAPGFFTFVAACSVLGSQSLLIGGSLRVAAALGVAGLLAWVAFTYTIFTVLTVKRDKPELARGINGGWLLAVVATQSMAVLAALIAPDAAQPLRLELNFFALSMWLWGGMLYIWMMSLIFYRYTFFTFSPADLSPPYWINMGAMAISTLAGSLLILNTPHAPFLRSMLPFIKGFTVFYWATGTWWIPMLVVLAIWRHGVRRFPFSYDPMYWGAVFPLGMYAASTLRMMEALQLPFLGRLPHAAFTVGMAAWALLFVGQLRALRRQWRAAPQTPAD